MHWIGSVRIDDAAFIGERFSSFSVMSKEKKKFESQMELITKSKERCFPQSAGCRDYGKEKGENLRK